jgi:hypothetical protein
MSYDPNVTVTYGGDRLVPAPQVNFSTELVYANDTIAGYSYIVTLSGYATALDLSSGGNNEYGLEVMSERIENIRNIFSFNGKNLLVTDKNNTNIMECRGGTVRSMSFDESNNNWVNYAPYKIEIEFGEILINGCSVSNTVSCSTLSIDPNGTAPNLIDITKYKVRSFNDSWSFSLSDQSYNSYGIFKNQYIDVEYTVSATGKHFYNSSNNVLPAWEQAKNFVQDRIHSQVNGLIGSILERSSGSDGCDASKTLQQLHSIASPGGIDEINSQTHKIYNETITCETSEAEGSFSATYKAILKHNDGNVLTNDCIHTFNKTKNTQKSAGQTNVSISIQGNIVGLIPGGLIKSPVTLRLPKDGKLLFVENSSMTKYSSALSVLNGSGGVLNSNRDDLSDNMKAIVGVSLQELLVSGCSGLPKASSFSTTHQYADGSIGYSAEYNTERACSGDKSYRNISISVEDRIPIVAEFIIPGRADGPIIQRIGPSTPRRISVTIEGVVAPDCCPTNLSNRVGGACQNGLVLPIDIPGVDIAGLKLVQNQETINSIDGSYVINRSYIDITN